MKRTIRITIFSLLLLINVPTYSQVKKLISAINSIGTKETISFKYNNKNQLVYFDEKGLVTYREFTLKYDKTNGRLTECTINEDKGELIQNIKYNYSNPDYIKEEVKTSGKKIQNKTIDFNNIYVDSKARLKKTTFIDGQLWEEFDYDSQNNILTYTKHSANGKSNSQNVYKFNSKNAVFLNIDNFPQWLLALHINNMRWVEGIIGENMPIEFTADDPRYGINTTEATYEYDREGYPVKQYYDGELVKEFIYRE